MCVCVLQELAFQADEDRKGQERMQEMIDKLQQKIKTYKRQVEEAVSASRHLHDVICICSQHTELHVVLQYCEVY